MVNHTNRMLHTQQDVYPLPSDWPSWTDSAGVLGCSWHAADGGLKGIHDSEHQHWSVKTSPNTPVRNNTFQTTTTILPLLLPETTKIFLFLLQTHFFRVCEGQLQQILHEPHLLTDFIHVLEQLFYV